MGQLSNPAGLKVMRFEDAPVAKVVALGFLNASYFARVFRTETEHRPAAYQRAIAEKHPKKAATFNPLV